MLLCTGIGANAQSISAADRAVINQKTDYVIKTLLDRQVSKGASKTTAVANERLLAQSDYSAANSAFVFANTDSSRYEYSGNLYSQFNLNSLEFGTYIVPYGDLPFGYGTYNNIGTASPNNTPDIMCNKATFWHNGTGPSGTLDKRDSFLQEHNSSYLVSRYDNSQLAGMPYRTVVSNTFGPPYGFVYSTTLWGGGDAASFDTLQRRYYAYDAANELAVDSTFDKGIWHVAIDGKVCIPIHVGCAQSHTLFFFTLLEYGAKLPVMISATMVPLLPLYLNSDNLPVRIVYTYPHKNRFIRVYSSLFVYNLLQP